MADKAPPKRPTTPYESPFAKGLAQGLGGVPASELAKALSRYTGLRNPNALPPFEAPRIVEAVGAASGSGDASAEGEIVGGEPKRRRRRTTPGKTYLHGADRTVRYYKPTEAELDRLGDLSRDEATAWGRMTFCLGLFVNVVFGLLFAVGLSSETKVAGAVIGVMSALGAGRFYFDARKKKADGKSALERVKADHDFANI